MTKLSTRLNEMAALEGFKVDVFDRHGKKVDLDTQGIPAYDYAKKAAGKTTVVEWKAARFASWLPGYTCDVLSADGSVAHGNKTLENVRTVKL